MFLTLKNIEATFRETSFGSYFEKRGPTSRKYVTEQAIMMPNH